MIPWWKNLICPECFMAKVLITGASGLIGRALVARYLIEGWQVIAQIRDKHDFEPHSFLTIIPFDLEKRGGGELLNKVGVVDLVINNAADQEQLQLLDRAGAIRQFVVNAIAPSEIAAAAKELGVSSLINISSVEALSARVGHEYYGATKAALESLTKSLANSLAPMRLISIRLGLVGDSSLTTRWPEGVAAWKDATPQARYASPDEVAQFAVLLSSDSLRYVTGSIFDFDGGKGANPGW